MKLKKLLAGFMTLAMLVTALPATVLAEEAKGTITYGYTNQKSIWGEGTSNSAESFVVELYANAEKIASTSLKNHEGIIDGDVYVTWSIPFDGSDSEFWDVEWEAGYPKKEVQPTKVVLLVDDVKVDENDVQMNGPDNLNKVEWTKLEFFKTYEAQIGEDKFETLEEAVKEAESGDTITLLADVEVNTLPSNMKLNIKGATGSEELKFIKAVAASGSDLTFEDVKFTWPNANYNGIQHVKKETYINCTIEGQPFLYGAESVFENCEFNQTSADAYNFWSYGSKDLTFTNCTFNSAGKSALIYNEGVDEKVTFDNCKFNASTPVEDKAAIEIDSTYANFEVTIKDCTMTGFDNGSVSDQPRWNIKKPGITNITVDGTTTVYETGDHTVTINETTTSESVPSTSSSNKSKKYDVIIKSADNGDVEVDDDYAKRGQEITITVDPDKGYELDELTITDQNGDEVDYDEGKKENTFVFDMPKSDVTIEASFDKPSSSVDDKEDVDKELVSDKED
ncbi:InlB B-repeat-containing protein, partial [Anaerotignum sp.]